MWVKIFLLVVAIALLSVTIFLVYENIPHEPEAFEIKNYSQSIGSLQVGLEEKFSSYDDEDKMQFYLNMRFTKLPVTHSIGNDCNDDKRKQIKQAMEILTTKANITFLEISEADINKNIDVGCSEESKKIETMFIAGEGGPVFIMNTSLYNVITKSKVFLFKSFSCDYPVVALHELLHAFGFDHSDDDRSVMYNISECGQKITQDIIDKLKELYAVPSQPDLFFSDVEVVKRGRYLDFEIEIRNRGLTESQDVNLSLYTENKKIKDFSIGEIKIGHGRFLDVRNLKMPSRKISSIKFVIDEKNIIQEIDRENNNIQLALREE